MVVSLRNLESQSFCFTLILVSFYQNDPEIAKLLVKIESLKNQHPTT